ncbi:MAG: DoxX family protein [Opitutaceae bacterium]
MKTPNTSSPSRDLAALVLRISLSVVLFAHGAQKLLGWFGGYGFHGTMQFFEGMHIPAFLGLIAILVEFFAPLFLFVGLFTRLAAFVMGVDMLVALLTVHIHNGFYMNWGSVPHQGEGYEFHLLFIGIAVALILLGGGRFAIDRALCKGKAETEPA